MMVLILQRVPKTVRGELTRWLIEPRPGVFVGSVSAMVRDRLWERCCRQAGGRGGVLLIWTTNTEQGFDLRSYGNLDRDVVDYEGLKLIRRPSRSKE